MLYSRKYGKVEEQNKNKFKKKKNSNCRWQFDNVETVINFVIPKIDNAVKQIQSLIMDYSYISKSH